MGRKIASDRSVGHIRTKLIDNLFPDTCVIYPPETEVINDDGTTDYELSPALEYNGDRLIPCRFVNSAHHRIESVFGEDAVVSEFECHLPFDVEVPNNPTIIYRGDTYRVRKGVDVESWNAERVFLVTRLEVGK